MKSVYKMLNASPILRTDLNYQSLLFRKMSVATLVRPFTHSFFHPFSINHALSEAQPCFCEAEAPSFPYVDHKLPARICQYLAWVK